MSFLLLLLVDAYTETEKNKYIIYLFIYFYIDITTHQMWFKELFSKKRKFPSSILINTTLGAMHTSFGDHTHTTNTYNNKTSIDIL